VPDLATLRLLPWLEATALVLCDVVDHEGLPVEVSPRRVLQRQLERAAERDLSVMCGTELEFFLYRDTYEELADRGYAMPRTSSSYNLDYHILQTTKDEPVIRAIRNQMIGAGLPVEFSKGEAAPGQHEINLRYAEALRMADNHTIYKNGCKEIAHGLGSAITFMAKPTIEEPGSSCHIHTSIWTADRSQPLCPGEDPTQMSPLFRSYMGGLLDHLADFTILGAPYINSYKRYLPDSWAPTAIVWSPDNRTCGLRLVGAGAAMRVESRIPGADANPYLAIAALVAAGLAGIESGSDCGEPFRGNAYSAEDVTRVPWNIADAIEAFRTSEVALKAFGEDVHFHLLHTAEQEWKAFHAAVTDWEWRRNFERI
jgi:glutamine synthetase